MWAMGDWLCESETKKTKMQEEGAVNGRQSKTGANGVNNSTRGLDQARGRPIRERCRDLRQVDPHCGLSFSGTLVTPAPR